MDFLVIAPQIAAARWSVVSTDSALPVRATSSHAQDVGRSPVSAAARTWLSQAHVVQDLATVGAEHHGWAPTEGS